MLKIESSLARLCTKNYVVGVQLSDCEIVEVVVEVGTFGRMVEVD